MAYGRCFEIEHALFRYVNSKFEPWRCEVEHAISGHGGPPQYWIFMSVRERNISFLWNLKVWSTVKICRTRVPQNAIVPVGRPRPYSILILNMRFIPKASLRASSQITASSYILERHLWVNNSKPLALAPTWSLACKQTDCISGCGNCLTPQLVLTCRRTFSQTLYIYQVLVQCWASAADIGLTLKQHWIKVSLK